MTWRDLIFEHTSSPEPSPGQSASSAPVVHPITVPSGTALASSTYLNAPVVSVSTPIPDDQLYDRLKQNTNFEIGSLQKVMDLAKPLEPIIADPVVRLKAALAQAQGQGVTLTDVDHDLQSLADQLARESEKFKHALDDRKSSVHDKENQAVALEQQLHDLRLEIADTKQKIDRADTGFQSALGRRSSELDQLKKQFAAAR